MIAAVGDTIGTAGPVEGIDRARTPGTAGFGQGHGQRLAQLRAAAASGRPHQRLAVYDLATLAINFPAADGDQREVDLLAVEAFENHPAGAGNHVDLDRRVRARERRQHPRQNTPAHIIRRAHTHRAVERGGKETGDRFGVQLQQLTCIAQQQLAVLR